MVVGDCQDMLKLKNDFTKDNRECKIIVDTNVLVYMCDNKKDIFEFAKNKISNASFYILDKSLEEIDKIYKQKYQKLKFIKNYLNKLKKVNVFEIIKVSDSLYSKYNDVDSLLVYFSKKNIIFTNDKELKQRIIKKKGNVLSLGLNDVFIN
jgi:rRNA-processing protein FCF1